MAMNNDFLEMIRCAVLAPSGHNTQPWRFRVAADAISICPDFGVSLPVVDGDNRELYISLGCAAENLCIAARHSGYAARVDGCGADGIMIGLAKDSGVIGDQLFPQIGKRQTNRSLYSGARISGGQLEELHALRLGDNIQVFFAGIGSSLAGKLAGYIAAGNAVQMADRAFREELLSWMRFNAAQAEAMGDGLSYKVFGNPSLPGWIARPIVRQFLKPGIQNRADLRKITSSSHLVLFTTEHNTVEEWIGLGRTLQRFVLTATGAGIACAFLNQPCEVVPLAEEMRKSLPVGGGYPTLILRIGYAAPVPRSCRREIRELIR